MFGYVIDNESGVAAHLKLGASIKATRLPDWNRSAINDPQHDMVDIVAPGRTTHMRSFTLPAFIRPGTYDVAWGLRDGVTGRRVALTGARGLLEIVR